MLMLACSVGPPATTRVVRSERGVEQVLSPDHAARIERALRALLSACFSNNTEWAGTQENWDTAASGVAIAAHYSPPIRIGARDGEIEVDAILYAPLSPDHVFARGNGEIFAFGKWPPQMEAELSCDPHLALRSHQRIQQFCDMVDGI